MITFPDLPIFKAKATHIYWEPVAGSGEKITAAVAMVDQFRNPRVISTLSPEVLKTLYRGKEKNALNILSWVTKSLEEFLLKNPNIDEWTPPLTGFSAAPSRTFVGDDSADIIAQITSLHSSLYRVAEPEAEQAKPEYHGNSKAINGVINAARALIGLKADDIFTQKGVVEVVDGNTVHQLQIPIQTKGQVGGIISAGYQKASTLNAHFLQTQSDLAIASKLNKRKAGLFLLRPAINISKERAAKIDSAIDNIGWRAKRLGLFFEVNETDRGLAETIINWAEIAS